MRLSLNFDLLGVNERRVSERGNPWAVVKRFVGGSLVLFALIGSSVAFSQSSEGPQEMPKPTFKTTSSLFQEWTFNNDQVDSAPPGFSSETVGEGSTGTWLVQTDPSAPSRPQAIILKPGCQQESCYHLLLADGTNVEYVDLSVRMKMVLGASAGKAGLVFGGKR